ncbi:MAG TPA: hypothetical protein VNX60_05710 [Candidatus Acidoferrum sp.]|nr:hypothetical protein [Candidatus Acidoferrum sp.]
MNPALLCFLLPIIVIAIEFAFRSPGFVTSIGVLLLREPAGKAAIFLSTVPILVLI